MPALPPSGQPQAVPKPCRTCQRAYAAEVLVCAADGDVLPLVGRVLAHKFRLERRLGDGGMASVWQATNLIVHRTVAIKLMHKEFSGDAELLRRFRNEAAAAGQIGSPHICDVLDFGECEIGPFIVMELLEGCSLAELMQVHRHVDPGLAVWIVRQALRGLAAAHRAGMVHRDLKPENIFLCRSIREQWVVKLMDFGISKFAHTLHTTPGSMMGTPHYMAPEQVRSASAVDGRADVWAIAVILHEAITGTQLFARHSVAETLAAVLNPQPVAVEATMAAAPPGLAAVLARCLQPDPAQRMASAEAMAAALAKFEQVPTRAALSGPAAAAQRHTAAARAVAPRPAARVKKSAHTPALPMPSRIHAAHARAATSDHAPVARAATGPQALRPASRPALQARVATGPQAQLLGRVVATERVLRWTSTSVWLWGVGLGLVGALLVAVALLLR